MGLNPTQKGKAIEHLIAVTCLLGSDGKLSISIPLLDDEGVDLLFTPKGGGKTIAVQVKSNFSSKLGQFKSYIKKKNFQPRKDYYLLFVTYDTTNAKLAEKVWLIPSLDFKNKLSRQTNEDKYQFQSTFSSDDMWKNYRVHTQELPKRILGFLK
jgi:hypothetical protein